MIWKVLGGVLLVKYGITMVQFLWLLLRLYVLPIFGMKLNLRKYGEWAVVTGATDGIGKAVAKQLAKRGLNIVLVSRSEDKLREVADEVESLNVKTKTIQYDFSKADGYDKITKELKDLDVGILINNVGMSYDHPDYFMYYSEEVLDKLVNINIVSVLKMTRAVMGGMVERKKGLVVSLCSGSALTPTPFLSTYSAAKAFVNFFGQALGYEYASQHIISQVVIPCFVATKMSKLRPSGLTVPTPEAYANQMVNALGLSPVMAGFWSHEILNFLIESLPAFIINHHMYTTFAAIRKRWHKKYGEKKD